MDDCRTRRWTGVILLAATLSVVVAGWAARADLIYFRGGGDAQLPATVEGNRVVLGLPDGTLELRLREDIIKRVPGFWPAEEWDSRRREARDVGVRGAICGGLVGDRERPDGRGGRRDPRAARPRPEARARRPGWPPCSIASTGRAPTPSSPRSSRRWGSSSSWPAGRTCCCSTSIPTPRPRSGWPCWNV